jgi:hypothetical protein
MKKIRFAVAIMIVSLCVGCGQDDNKQISIEAFIQHAEQNGLTFEEWDSGHPKPNLTYYWVNPGKMLIWFEVVPDAKAAKQKVKEFNQGLGPVLKVVKRDNTKASQMGESPKAYSNGNVVLFVPLNYVVHYDEAKILTALFNKY